MNQKFSVCIPGRKSFAIWSVSRYYKNHGAQAFYGRAVTSSTEEKKFLFLFLIKRVQNLPQQSNSRMAFIIPASNQGTGLTISLTVHTRLLKWQLLLRHENLKSAIRRSIALTLAV